MAVGAGLQVMAAMMDADVERGVRAARAATTPSAAGGAPRHGRTARSTLGGRRVPVTPAPDPRRRRDRRAAGRRPMSCSPRPSCWAGWRWRGCWPSCRPAATRSGLEPVGTAGRGRALVRRASPRCRRRFVAATETALAELLAADLSGLDLVALMIDGVHFGEHLCVVALGIGIDGTKHPLGLVEGSTENTTVVTDLLTGLRDRGLDTTRPIFVVHRRRQGTSCRRDQGVRPSRDRLAASCTRSATSRRSCPRTSPRRWPPKMRAAYHVRSRWPPKPHSRRWPGSWRRPTPAPPGRLREGLAETLTVTRLGVPPTLARTLRSTNSIESMIEICRDHSTNVKRWRDGTDGAALVRRRHARSRQTVPPGQRLLAPARPASRTRRHVNITVTPKCDNAEVPPENHGPPPKFHGTRDILLELSRAP